jgi:hypothetical protein
MGEEKFYDLDQDTLDVINDIVDNMALPFSLQIKYIGNTKLKNVIKLQKTSDYVQHLTSIDLIVFINEDYFNALEGESSKILIHQELDRLEFDINKGTFKIGKYRLQTTEGVLIKYGIEAVSQANQLSELYTQQKADTDNTDEFDAKEAKTRSITKKVDFLS